MDTSTIILSAAAATLLLTSINILAAPEAIVIEQHSSQVTEQLTAHSNLSFTPIKGTIVPLDKHYPSFQLPDFQNNERRNWREHLGQPVRVEHKNRDLSFQGILESISENTFTLNTRGVTASYPMTDFYLIPTQPALQTRKKLNYQGQVTYQTADLSWQAMLSLIIEDKKVILKQQASIKNNASDSIKLNQALLHYNQHNDIIRPMLRRDTMEASISAPNTDYSNSEITLELTNLSLAAASETLVDLGQHSAQISHRSSIANVVSTPSSSKLPLNFSQQITFNSPKDLIPGDYQTLWRKQPYLVRGNQTHLKDVRENTPVQVQLNRSLDLVGNLTLIDESSNSTTITQTWLVELKNLSRYDQAYQIVHHTSWPIKDISLGSAKKTAANSATLKGRLAANSTYQTRYTVKLYKR